MLVPFSKGNKTMAFYREDYWSVEEPQPIISMIIKPSIAQRLFVVAQIVCMTLASGALVWCGSLVMGLGNFNLGIGMIVAGFITLLLTSFIYNLKDGEKQ
jgi:hypothetical protein